MKFEKIISDRITSLKNSTKSFFSNYSLHGIPNEINIRKLVKNVDRLSLVDFDPVCLTQPEFWASIIYHEQHNTLGKSFKCKTESVIVNGSSANKFPNNKLDTYCIGDMENPDLTPSIEKERKYIGRGVKFHCDNDGNIWAINLSKHPIYLQSTNMNYFNRSSMDTVVGMPPGSKNIIFKQSVFFKLLLKQLKRVKSIQQLNHDDESVIELFDMCTIRMSFITEWGPNYLKLDASCTPCWLELELHAPMNLLINTIGPLKPTYRKRRSSMLF